MDKDKYIGRLLDNRYEILEVIGTGGMAVVYKARCHRLNRLVAVKILKDDNLEDEDFRRRFHAESQAVAMLSHPNIVSVYDVSTSVMADYIVMELIEGITLKQYMEKKGTLNWKETLHFAIQIAKALEHAHSKGIVHRDIKPHNVMVLKNGSVKVMDFGIARLISRGNTLTKEALGSVHYISPEQAKGGRVDNRSDIYSLGVVMYEMMAGRPPYDGESPVSVAIQHINGGASLPSVYNPNIPGGLEQIIMRAMARNLSDRYPSATRMLADMDEFRKDPAMLFDYTGLPLDAGIRMQKPPLVLNPEPPKTTPRGQTGSGVQRIPNERRREERQRQEAQRRRKQEEKRTKIATIAIVVCSLVALIAIGILLSVGLSGGFSPKEKMVKVPDIVGMEFAQLSSLPEYSKLDIKKDEIFDDTVPAGQIISVKPTEGTEVAEGALVVVTVSKGPMLNEVKMGNLQGRTREWAESYLNGQGLNLNIEIKPENNDTVAVGNVIRTSPEAGAKLTQGQTITLWISLGKKIQFAPMPDVVGAEAAAAKKTLELQEMGLNIVIEEVFHPTIKEGIVIESSPDKVERLQTGQTVTLYVSKGVEKKAMPDMVGMDVTKAVSQLEGLGFKNREIKYVPGRVAKDTVLSQTPEKDLEYELDVKIVLEVSDGSLMPVYITKDVVIDLRGNAKNNACNLVIERDGEVAFDGRVTKGTTSITLPDQGGTGTVTYTVVINNTTRWTVDVVFTDDQQVTPDE